MRGRDKPVATKQKGALLVIVTGWVARGNLFCPVSERNTPKVGEAGIAYLTFCSFWVKPKGEEKESFQQKVSGKKNLKIMRSQSY